MHRIKEKIHSFSKWFKVCFCVLFAVYLMAWGLSIYLSSVQNSRQIKPLLPVMYQDSHEYADLAQSLLHGQGFIQNGKNETFRVPGYPSFVAFLFFFGGYFLITLVQIILVFLSALIIRETGIVFSGKKVGELSAIIFLLSPVVLILSLIILTDVLFLFLLLLGFYLAVSINKEKYISKVILVSVIFSCAIYVRPMGIFALPIFISPLLVSKLSIWNKIKSIILMIIIILALLSPWIMRNYKLTGVADFSSFKAMNLACCATPLYLSNINGTTPAQEMEYIARGSGVPQSDWRDLRFSPALSAFTEKIILDHPFSYAKYHLVASLPFLFSSSVEEAIYQYKSAMGLPIVSNRGVIHYLLSGQFRLFFEGIMAVWWKILERMILVMIYLVAIFGFWKERKNPMVWAFAFIPIYLMALSGPAANVRYAVQALPYILILFSSGFFILISKLKNTRNIKI